MRIQICFGKVLAEKEKSFKTSKNAEFVIDLLNKIIKIIQIFCVYRLEIRKAICWRRTKLYEKVFIYNLKISKWRSKIETNNQRSIKQ